MIPLRVGFELTGLELDAAGSARAADGLLGALKARPDLEMVTIRQPRRGRGAGRLVRGVARELVWFPLQLPLRTTDLDLLHCPFPLAPPRFRTPLVLTLYDTFVWDHPQWYGRGIRWQHRLSLVRAVRAATRILTASEYTRSRIIELFGVEPDLVTVTPLGLEPAFSPGQPDPQLLDRLGVRTPYVLAVGTRQPRKNLGAALDAAPLLDGRTLVVAGARGWRDDKVEARLGSAGVRVLDRVDDDMLVNLYRGADCLLFPSLAEGFGYPVLEAMACGTPVVALRTTSIPEVAGEAAILCESDAPEELAEAVRRAVERRDELRTLGLARAAAYTWDRCADLTAIAYRDAHAQRAG